MYIMPISYQMGFEKKFKKNWKTPEWGLIKKKKLFSFNFFSYYVARKMTIKNNICLSIKNLLLAALTNTIYF